MNKGTIILFLFFILLIVGGVVVYFMFERPAKSNVTEYSNVSVIIKTDDMFVETEYTIEMNGIFYKNGRTTNIGASLERIPRNSTIKIYNSNINSQQYYRDIKEVYVNDSYQRITLNLVEPGELKMNKINDNLLEVKSEGIIRDVKFCLSWTGQIIYVKSNFTQIPKLAGFEKTDKCFDTEKSINNNFIHIPLNYQLFGTESNAEINVIIIDANFNNKTYNFINY